MMNDLPVFLRRKPSTVTAWVSGIGLVAIWGIVRLLIFGEAVFPLTYTLPLLICVWTRRKRLLWTMAGIFALMAFIKFYLILSPEIGAVNVGLYLLLPTLINIGVGAIVIHLIILLLERLERSFEDLAQTNTQVRQQNEELAQQAEELSLQNEELAQQSEELSQQNEEIQAQSEELQAQSEDIQTLNVELGQREDILQRLLDSARHVNAEQTVVADLCDAAAGMFGYAASAVVFYEVQDNRLVALAQTGLKDRISLSWPLENSFMDLTIRENRTACLNDTSLRPDLWVIQVPVEDEFHSVLCSPMHIGDKPAGAVTVYCRHTREWSDHQFRLAEWLAAQCGSALQTVRMQQALRISEERYRALFVNMTEGFALGEVMYDESGMPVNFRFIDANDAFTDQTGIKKQDILNVPIKRALKNVEKYWIDTYGNVAMTGEPAHISNYNTDTGKYYDVYCYSPAKGRFAILFRDITQQKESEMALLVSEETARQRAEEVEKLMSLAPTAIWVARDPQCRTITGNKAANRFYESDERENVSAGPDADVHDTTRRFFREGRELKPEELPMQEAAARGEDVRDSELDVLLPSGRMITMLGNASPLWGAEGQVRGCIGAFVDITERKKAEEELRSHRDHLEDLVRERTVELETRNNQLEEEIAERKRTEGEKKELENQLLQAQKMEALGRFAGGIAHDLNNILYPIIINTEMLLEDTAPGTPLNQTLEQLLQAAYRQRDLIKQILSFSRRKEKKFTPVKVTPLIEETLVLLRSSFPSTIEIRHNLAAANDSILADPTQIQQIIMNLCKNAADSIDSKKGVIEVSLLNTLLESPDPGRGMKPGEYLALTVEDSGGGISSEILPHIFEPFFTTKEVGKGSGMGLAVVHGILKDHGGTITVESELGKGSRFIAYIPVTDKMMREHVTDAAAADPDNGKEKILLIDDEDIILSSVSKALNKLGYDVHPVKDSIEALQLFTQCSDTFDLVITDLTMPQMNGLELASRITDIRPDIPVILCTGFSDTIDKHEVKSLGIRELLMKPAGTRELRDVIRRALEN